MYLKSVNSYKEYSKMSNKLKQIILSRLISLYPNVRNNYINTMNPEEQILFDAKIIRLECENEIRIKCIDNIYPNEWVYNFNKDVKGREFTKRFRNIVSRMREKLFLLLNQHDFDALYQDSVRVLETVQNELREIRQAYPEYKTIDFEELEEGVHFFESHDLTQCLAFDIYKIIFTISEERTIQSSMLYLYSFIRQKQYFKTIDYCVELFDYNERRRFFSIKKMIRKYKEYPCVITYLYHETILHVPGMILNPQPIL